MATKAWCKSTPSIPYSSSSGNAARQLEGRNHLVGRGEFDPRVAPVSRTGGHAVLVQASRRVLDETHLPAPLKKCTYRRVITDVGGDAEDDDLVWIEGLEQ